MVEIFDKLLEYSRPIISHMQIYKNPGYSNNRGWEK